MAEENILDLAKRIKAIADIGLLYTKDNFDIERYHELGEIGLHLMSISTGTSIENTKAFFSDCIDYPTPKVDVRALVLNAENQILLVQEKNDECWSLPGGWADIGTSAAETAFKEVEQETGIKVNVERLLAVFDKSKHAHPPQPYYVYKLFFHCSIIDTLSELKPAFDVLDVRWFDLEHLPPLSRDRVLAEQIQTLYKRIKENITETLFD